MSEVLVLNRGYVAVNIADWVKSISLLYTSHAVVIDPEDHQRYNFADWAALSKMKVEAQQHNGKIVRSQNLVIMVPDIIALLFYDKLPPREAVLSRHSIFERDGYRCAYCKDGKRLKPKDLTLDHVIPRIQGGKNSWENLVTACIACNSKKGGMSPKEAGMTLYIRPRKPEWQGRLGVKLGLHVKVKESWQMYLDKAYWGAGLKEY